VKEEYLFQDKMQAYRRIT